MQRCPNCKKNTLINTTLGEVCKNDDCGYVDGIVMTPRSKWKAPLTPLQRANRTIRALESTIADLQKRLWRAEHSSCVHCGRGPSHPADGC